MANYNGSWSEEGNYYVIQIKDRDFNYPGYASDHKHPTFSNAIKIPKSGGTISGRHDAHLPQVHDVRHTGAAHMFYGYSDTDSPNLYCKKPGDTPSYANGWIKVPKGRPSDGDVWANPYNANRNKQDNQQYVYKCPNITAIRPRTSDGVQTEVLYNYDTSSRNIHVSWNNFIWHTVDKSPYDIIAVRARYSLNFNSSHELWSAWFHKFAPAGSGRWENGFGDESIILYGEKPSAANSNNNFLGFGNTFNQVFKDKLVWHNGKYDLTYIPPHYPYSITVQVQIASCIGVSAITTSVSGNIYQQFVSYGDGSHNGQKIEVDRRRIYVAPRLGNDPDLGPDDNKRTEGMTFNKTRYVDRISLEVIGPALDMSTMNNIFGSDNESGKCYDTWFHPKKPDDDRNNQYYKQLELFPFNMPMVGLRVYAKKRYTESPSDFKKVYTWTAPRIGGAYAIYWKYSYLHANLSFQHQEHYSIPWTDEDVLDVHEDYNSDNIEGAGYMQKPYFVPMQDLQKDRDGEWYELAIYCEIWLNDTYNTKYNGGVDEEKTTITLRKNMYVRTLPKTVLYTTTTPTSGTPYKYIHGLSLLYKGGYERSDYFMTFSTTKQFTSEEIREIREASTWSDYEDQVKDQIRPIRLRLEVKKTGHPSVIISRYLNPNYNEAEGTHNGITKLDRNNWGYNDYHPMINLTETEWDRIYQMFPGNSSSTPNQVSATIQLFTTGSYTKNGQMMLPTRKSRRVDSDSEFNSIISYPDTVKNITIRLTGIQKTAHLNDHKTAEDKSHRAYVWVNPLQSEGPALRAVTWVNPEEAEKDKYDRSI